MAFAMPPLELDKMAIGLEIQESTPLASRFRNPVAQYGRSNSVVLGCCVEKNERTTTVLLSWW